MSDYETQVQTLVLVVLLVTAGVAPASFSADATPPGGGGTTFHVAQGGECYEVAAYGDGNASVVDFYDYRSPNTDPSGFSYSSHGTTHLQENQVSNVFLYHGTDGYSLVMLHDERGDAPYGSTVTFEISGLPADREWVVEDDAYQGRDDEFYHGPTSSTIHWKWARNRTDGAAVRGLGGGYEAVTIDPAFNEDAARWGDWIHSGGNHRVHEWRLLDADGTAVSLDMDRSASVARGGCDDDGTTTTTTTTETTTSTTTEPTQTTSGTTQTTTTTQTSTTTQTTTTSETTQTTSTTTETTQTTTETTQTTTETTQTTTTTDEDDSSGDDSNGDDGSSGAIRDQNPGSSQSGGGQPPADEEPARATADLTDADGVFGNVTLEADADASPEIETDESPPADVRAPATERDGFAALSYLRAETDGSTATVTLSSDHLESLGASPSEVALFRYENGSWTAVETEQVNPADGDGESNETMRFRADVTDGTYAVGVERPAIGVADLTVDGAEPTVGESVEVVATVENRGLADGTRTVTVAVGRETVASRNVSVPAGESREVVVAYAFEETGVHDVEVGDERASVVVEGVETTESETETTEATASTPATTLSTTDATSDSAPGVPGFGVGVALVALVGAALLVLRRG